MPQRGKWGRSASQEGQHFGGHVCASPQNRVVPPAGAEVEELEEHLDGGGRRRGHTDVQQSDTGEQADEKYRRYPYQEGGCQTVEQGEAGAAAAAVKPLRVNTKVTRMQSML